MWRDRSPHRWSVADIDLASHGAAPAWPTWSILARRSHPRHTIPHLQLNRTSSPHSNITPSYLSFPFTCCPIFLQHPLPPSSSPFACDGVPFLYHAVLWCIWPLWPSIDFFFQIRVFILRIRKFWICILRMYSVITRPDALSLNYALWYFLVIRTKRRLWLVTFNWASAWSISVAVYSYTFICNRNAWKSFCKYYYIHQFFSLSMKVNSLSKEFFPLSWRVLEFCSSVSFICVTGFRKLIDRHFSS